MMMQTILAGLDWGETVDVVATTAVDLAVAFDASLKAVYVEDVRLIEATEQAILAVLPSSGSIPLEIPNMAELEEKFQTEERALGRRFLRLLGDTRVRGSFLVERGEVAEILIRESRAHDLVVLGKYSEAAAEEGDRRPLGRHVEEILRRTWCPVVLAPPEARLSDRLLVAYDGSEGAHRALATTVRLARATEAQLSILVAGKGEAAETLSDEALRYAESHRMAARLVRREGDPSEEVLAEAEAWDAGLVAFGAYGPHHRKGTYPPHVAFDILRDLHRLALVCGSREEA